ncbi:MAG: hypothetical protein RRY79_06360 [Clostridia bacterium]
MKNAIKVIFAVSMILVLAMSLAACKPATPKPSGSPAASTVPSGSPAASTKPSTAPSTVPSGSPAASTAPEKEMYKNDTFTFELPASWIGKYEAKPMEDGYEFISIANKADGGILCTITAVPEANKPSNPDDKILKTADGKNYILSLPTDIQYSIDAKLQAEYKAMYEDIAMIISTFALIAK